MSTSPTPRDPESRSDSHPRPDSAPAKGLTYADAGVDIDAGDEVVERIQRFMRRTHGPRVIDIPGGFANLFRLDYNERLFRRNYRDPVLVAGTDGVGTKVKLAIDLGVYGTIGIDCVAMCVNDIIVQGAEPLFFLDYVAVHKVIPEQTAEIIRGVAQGCALAECALIGGETAEMSDLYRPGDFDLAGFAVGVVELDRAIDPGRVERGDVVLGLASDGLHSNGFTLVRKIVERAGLDLRRVYPELASPARAGARATGADLPDVAAGQPTGEPTALREHAGDREQVNGGASEGPAPDDVESAGSSAGAAAGGSAAAEVTLGEVLLTPTRIYAGSIVRLLRKYTVKKIISGMAHITGGGLEGNVCRALHGEVDAVIDRGAWAVPPVFRFLQQQGGVAEAEMWRVFNMGIGYVLIVRPAFANSVAQHLRRLGETVYEIGRVEPGTGVVRFAD